MAGGGGQPGGLGVNLGLLRRHGGLVLLHCGLGNLARRGLLLVAGQPCLISRQLGLARDHTIDQSTALGRELRGLGIRLVHQRLLGSGLLIKHRLRQLPSRQLLLRGGHVLRPLTRRELIDKGLVEGLLSEGAPRSAIPGRPAPGRGGSGQSTRRAIHIQ